MPFDIYGEVYAMKNLKKTEMLSRGQVEQDRNDVINTIRLTMRGATVFGDYLIERGAYGSDSDEDDDNDNDNDEQSEEVRKITAGIGRNLVNVFLLLQSFGASGDNNNARRSGPASDTSHDLTLDANDLPINDQRDYEDYLRRQNLVIQEDETLDETPNFVEAVAVRKKTLFVSGLSHEAEISDIINFFKDVGQVFCLRLIVDYTGKHVGDGFVEFSSANEAEKALEKKNGEYLHDHKIYIDVAKKAPYPLRPKYCIDHKVWYEDYLRQENLLIEENEAVEGDDKILEYIEEVAARRKTLFIANIPCKTSIPTIVHFFKNVGRVALLRLIVDHRGQRVGCGFVEFAYAKEAEKALEKMSNRELSLDVAEIAPYPLRPKYNLAEKLWSKVESLLVEEEEEEEAEEEEEEEEEEEDYDLETKPDFKKQVVPMMMGGVCCKKVTFCYAD